MTINTTVNTATCTTRGGYPEPEVTWTGQNQSCTVQLVGNMSLLKDPTEKTFSVTSTVSIKDLKHVTCSVYNPRCDQRINATAPIDGPDEDTYIHIWVPLVVSVIVIVTGIAVSIKYKDQLKQRCPQACCRGYSLPDAASAHSNETKHEHASYRFNQGQEAEVFLESREESDEPQSMERDEECKDESARLSEPKVDINKTNKTATCTTKGGYPKPEITWIIEDGVNQTERTLEPHQVQTTMTPEEDGTYSIRSTINVTVTKSQKVTCIVYNPTSNKTQKHYAKIPPVNTLGVGALVGVGIGIVIAVVFAVGIGVAGIILWRRRSRRRGTEAENSVRYHAAPTTAGQDDDAVAAAGPGAGSGAGPGPGAGAGSGADSEQQTNESDKDK
ncbi:CD276 antigen-like [Scomber scombrus]|uniref:CD276 antigen-like n=1 Tax=Scomber scombrus TaxID=13677 RepID=UPI002DD9A8BF|nr:CD276 antigen-like [Scomber scombrus]